MEPITIEPEVILARLTERMTQIMTDPRVGQLTVEVAIRDVAIEQLQARVQELENQLKSTGSVNNGAGEVESLVSTRVD